MNVLDLWLPIALSAIALFFMSFLSWMVLQLHKGDWRSIPREDELLETARKIDLAPGNYMFPGCQTAAERNSPGFKENGSAGRKGS